MTSPGQLSSTPTPARPGGLVRCATSRPPGSVSHAGHSRGSAGSTRGASATRSFEPVAGLAGGGPNDGRVKTLCPDAGHAAKTINNGIRILRCIPASLNNAGGGVWNGTYVPDAADAIGEATEDRVRLLLEAGGLPQSARQSACLAVPAHRRCTSCSRLDQSKRLVPWGWPASSCTCRLG